MPSHQNLNLDSYAYSLGSPFGEMLTPQRNGTQNVQMSDQALSPPYSNQSPPHSVQSSLTLSPQGYIGENTFTYNINIILYIYFLLNRISFSCKITSKSTNFAYAYGSNETCYSSKAWESSESFMY